MELNPGAMLLCRDLLARQESLRAKVSNDRGGTIIDLGIDARGGLEAGRLMAEVCLAGLGCVQFERSDPAIWQGLAVSVRTDHPVLACLGSQYAGWRISRDRFFAMGSGPMRAAAAAEALLIELGIRESAKEVVGVLETRALPPPDVMDDLARQCQVPTQAMTLLVAPTASQAGTVQVVARSLETALHKLHELGFDMTRLESGWGIAPLPPVAADDLAAIGRTNDAVLYGAEGVLWVRGDDASLAEVGSRVPSSASPDYGEPFSQIFRRYDCDFYKIDPNLFSPAAVTFVNLDTGRTQRFGRIRSDIIEQSFLS